MTFFICTCNVSLYHIYLVLIRKFGIAIFKNPVFPLNVSKITCTSPGGHGLIISLIKEKLLKYVKGRYVQYKQTKYTYNKITKKTVQLNSWIMVIQKKIRSTSCQELFVGKIVIKGRHAFLQWNHTLNELTTFLSRHACNAVVYRHSYIIVICNLCWCW